MKSQSLRSARPTDSAIHEAKNRSVPVSPSVSLAAPVEAVVSPKAARRILFGLMFTGMLMPMLSSIRHPLAPQAHPESSSDFGRPTTAP